MLSSLAPFHAGPSGRPTSATEQNAASLGQEAGRASGRGKGLAAPGPAGEPTPLEQGHGGGSFDKAARKLVNRALDSLGRDLDKLFRGFGDLAGTVKQLVSATLEPVREALAQGQDFTAEIRIAAARRQTLMTEGGYAQSLDLVAKSLTIEVNHTTGEVAVDLQSLSLQQSVAVGFADAAPEIDLAAFPQGLDSDDATGATAGDDHRLGDFVRRFLQETRTVTADEETEAEKASGPAAEQILPALETGRGADRPSTQAKNEEEADRPARLALRGAERFRNEVGHLVTRLRLDVAVQVVTPSDLRDLAESLPAKGNGSGFDLHA